MVLKVTLFFIQSVCNTSEHKKDDVIRIFSTSTPDSYRVVYKPWEHKKVQNEFTMNYMEVLNYINTIIRSLENDDDPLDCIQISTAIHPSILFRLSDLEVVGVRNIFDDMIRSSLRTYVKRIVIEQQQYSPSCSQ